MKKSPVEGTGTFELTFNGITRRYSVELWDFDEPDDEPSYLRGNRWYVLVERMRSKDGTYPKVGKAVEYATGPDDAASHARTAQVFADAAVGKADATYWLAGALRGQERIVVK